MNKETNPNVYLIDESITDSSVAVDLLAFVENPFSNSKRNDIVSKIYQSFQSIKCSQAIPIYYTFTLLSYWNLINGVRLKLPNDPKEHIPNLWVMALAKSGAAKSTAVSVINSLLPTYGNKPILQPSFQSPASSASIIEQFHNQKIHFWVEDEAAQWLKRVENPSDPLSAAKGYLLKAKNGEQITYNTKANGSIVIEDPQMSLMWINTIDGMKNTISSQSFVDGLASRITAIVAENRSEPNSNYFDISQIHAAGLAEDFKKLFDQKIESNVYTFSNAARTIYDKTITFYRQKPFSNMQGEDNYKEPFFDRYAFDAHKYAVFHHQIHHKKGTVIDEESMQFALRVVAFNLRSLLRFLWLRNPREGAAFIKLEDRQKAQQKRIKEFVTKNYAMKGFALRSLTRKFGMNREEMISCLKSLKSKDASFSPYLDFLMQKKSITRQDRSSKTSHE